MKASQNMIYIYISYLQEKVILFSLCIPLKIWQNLKKACFQNFIGKRAKKKF